MHSFFTLDEVRIIGFFAIGVLGFSIPFTIWAGIKYYQEARDISLDKKWAKYSKATGKPEPASNRARDTPYVPKRSQQPSQRSAAPRKPSAAPSKAQAPKALPKAVQPSKQVGDKPWEKWSAEM